MNVFLPIVLKRTGGTSTFAQKFKKELEKRGHTVCLHHEETNYDILLASPRCPLKHLIEAKQKRKPIIHRLDGVYYPATIAGWRFPLHNFPLQIIRYFFADYTIYQSKYSKHCCDRFLGPSPHERHSIIYNGVDTDLFSPDGERQQLRDNDNQHVFITASRFRRKDQIVPLLHAFEQYNKTHEANSKLVVIGDFNGEVASVPQTHQQIRRIYFIGPIPNEQLPSFFRAADVFLFTHQNPPCPNNVIEAMACGLPVCGVADGAMVELTKPGCTSELIPARGSAFFTRRTLDSKALAQNMHTVITNRDAYSQQSRNHALQHFSIEHMVDQYLAVFNRVLS